MAYSKILVEFTDVPNSDEHLGLFETSLGIDLSQTFKIVRAALHQTQIPHWMPNDGIHPDRYIGFISSFYKNALNLDINSGGLFTIVATNGIAYSGIGTVLITANFPNAIFTGGVNSSIATYTITNEVMAPPFTIDSIVFTASDIPCRDVRVSVNTSELAVKLISPVSINPNITNPVEFDFLRANTINVIVENASGVQASMSVTTPPILSALNFSTQINNSPNGATVIINATYSNGLDLQYSLDNATWQSSNVFGGLAVGSYTVYINDQYRCECNFSFDVIDAGIYTPYFYISKSNSFRFANRITWGDSANYKNDENTLSCEVDVQMAWKELQLFQSADIITTQFKSNYSTNIVSIIKEDSSIINVPVTQKTNNIGIKDKRDARQYNLGNGKTGVYFISGNYYDYTTGVDTGEDYVLNGLLPEWGKIGNYINISGFWFLIENIIFDEAKNADVIVFSNTYTGAEINVIAASKFNRFNYEVYEFTIDMVDYIDEKFSIKLENSDPHFQTITHLSEKIWCKVKHKNTLEIRYWNTTNTDILYSTGIEHKIRITYIKVTGKIEEQSEIHKTDTDAILLNADIYEVDEFLFWPVTKEIWRKLMQALSHEKVLINEVGYVKTGTFNTEGAMDKSNLYQLTATMIKTGNIYNSEISGSLEFNDSSGSVPGLISTQSGFISY